jgi:hypothetical protein
MNSNVHYRDVIHSGQNGVNFSFYTFFQLPNHATPIPVKTREFAKMTEIHFLAHVLVVTKGEPAKVSKFWFV